MSDKPSLYCLGPMGNPNPTDLFKLETGRIPFKYSNMKISDWEQTFRSWPNVTLGWRNWYLKISASKRGHWDDYDISHVLPFLCPIWSEMNLCWLQLPTFGQIYPQRLCVWPWSNDPYLSRCPDANRSKHLCLSDFHQPLGQTFS